MRVNHIDSKAPECQSSVKVMSLGLNGIAKNSDGSCLRQIMWKSGDAVKHRGQDFL
jgi:hypothetical protein